MSRAECISSGCGSMLLPSPASYPSSIKPSTSYSFIRPNPSTVVKRMQWTRKIQLICSSVSTNSK